MRKAIFLAVLLYGAASCYGQQTTPSSASPKEDLRKSQSQKAGAWMLIGLGSALFVGSALNDMNNLFDVKEQTHDGFYIASAASVAGAVYLFVAAARNKRKAREATVTPAVHMESTPVPLATGMRARSYPALGLTLKF